MKKDHSCDHGAVDRPRRRRGPSAALCSAFGLLLGGSMAVAVPAYPTRTQTIELKEGWNAVFLEVEPADPAPAAVFAGTPVDAVAQYFRPVRTAQFATDPNELLANNEGWGIWYGPDREESVFSNLHALHSHNAFLVHAKEDFTWRITGQVYLKRIYWKPDSFNLVGFPVSSAAAPTFAEYFQGITAHQGQPMFRLVDGKWRKIDNPAATVMRRGEAYWIYSDGGSDYQGPCDLRVQAGDHLRFAEGQFSGALTVHNRSPHPLSITLTQSGGGLAFDFLFKGILETGTESFAAVLPETYAMPAMEAGVKGAIALRIHSAEAAAEGATNLFRITSDAGTEYWVAAYAEAASRP